MDSGFRRLWVRYQKLFVAAQAALRKLARVQHESDSTKEQKALLEALKEDVSGKPIEKPEDDNDS